MNAIVTAAIATAVGGIMGALIMAVFQSRATIISSLLREQNARIEVLDGYAHANEQRIMELTNQVLTLTREVDHLSEENRRLREGLPCKDCAFLASLEKK